MELIYDAEQRCVSDNVYVILVGQKRSVGFMMPPVN